MTMDIPRPASHANLDPTIEDTIAVCARRLVCVCFVLIAPVYSVAGLAQVPNLPGPAQPGRIGKDLDVPKEPAVDSKEIQLKLPGKSQERIPANASSIRFLLRSIELDGNATFSTESLLPLWQEKIEKDVSLLDIYTIAQSITDLYQTAGYVLSFAVVPTQEITDGKVRLQVVEGYIRDVQVQDPTGQPNEAEATRLADSLRKRPLRLETLERVLLLVNDYPGTSAQAYLTRSDQVGATALTVVTTRTPITASASADNRGTHFVGKTRWAMGVSANGVLGLNERNAISVQGTNDNRLQFASFSHELPIGRAGIKALFSYMSSRANPRTNAGVGDLLQKSSSTTLGASYPLIRSRNTNLTLRGTLTMEDSDSYALGGLHLTSDRVRPLRLGLVWDQVGGRGASIVDFEITRGLKGMGATAQDSALLTRTGSKIDFTKANIYAARLQSLGGRWSLLAVVTGQYTSCRLVPIEQLGLGGEYVLRGFDASELLGDKGLGAKVELRSNLILGGVAATAYGFYDHGQVWTNDLGGGTTRTVASSTGVGMRFGPVGKASGYIELDQPLAHNVASVGNRRPRAFAGIGISY